MKRLILINGAMGAGKTATCLKLKQLIPPCVFLDGDWCWDMNPFTVTEETREMVEGNIAHLLRSFLDCSAFENIIFCWVMHEESIVENLLARLEGAEYELHRFTLTLSREALERRILLDVENGARTIDVLGRSLDRLALYEKMNTVKIDVGDITPEKAARRIRKAIGAGIIND